MEDTKVWNFRRILMAVGFSFITTGVIVFIGSLSVVGPIWNDSEFYMCSFPWVGIILIIIGLTIQDQKKRKSHPDEHKNNSKVQKLDYLLGGFFLIVIGIFLFGMGNPGPEAPGYYRVVGIFVSGLIFAIIGLVFVFYFITSNVRYKTTKIDGKEIKTGWEDEDN